jgi:diguanylate cyclase (GGDEF)-like protein
MAEYLTIVLYVTGSYDLSAARALWGEAFSWGDQLGRVIQLGVATALNVYIVLGMQRQRRLSTSDPLTGLFNRGFFDHYLGKEVERANRYGTVFTVAMIDIDHFKQFNDAFGHAAGDRALRTVARVMLRAVRRSDIVARYGGEELVVIFRETEADLALERVEQIRQAVEAEAFAVGRQAGSARITVSAGVASWPADGLTGDDVLAMADRRLFDAKGAGRNRVVGPNEPARLPATKL